MTTVLTFAGARLSEKQCKNSSMRKTMDKYSQRGPGKCCYSSMGARGRAAVKSKI